MLLSLPIWSAGALAEVSFEGSNLFVEPCEEGSGNLVEAYRYPILPFSGIEIVYKADVVIEQGDDDGIRVEADDNVIDHIIVDVVDDTLVIDVEDGYESAFCDVIVNVHIYNPDFEKMAVTGSGSIISESELTLQNLVGEITGSGSIELEGSVDTLEATITGSGDIKVSNLIAQTAAADISGAGDIVLHVEEFLNAAISGVGNIHYSGNPGEVVKSITGIGEIAAVDDNGEIIEPVEEPDEEPVVPEEDNSFTGNGPTFNFNWTPPTFSFNRNHSMGSSFGW